MIPMGESAYCSVQNVRDLTGLTTVDISTTIVSGIIAHASAQLNADIQIEWKDERVSNISVEKENLVDGRNTKYYTAHFPIGDRDDNGVVSGIDVYAYTLDSDGARTQIVVSGITNSELGGPLWLTTPPSSNIRLYFTYFSSPVDMEAPHRLVNLACSQLAAALCFTRIDVTKVQSYRIGKIAVMRQSQAFDIFRRQYYDTINRIRQEMFKTGQSEIVL